MSQQKKDHTGSGAAIAGAGGTTATVGLVGGGVPGARPNRLLADVKEASGRRQKAGTLARAYQGGEFGYRTNAHKTFSNFSLAGGRSGESRAAHHEHGIKAGKLAAEDKIIRHLKVGRRASTAALVGGTSAAVYGVRRAQGKKTFGKADDKRGKAVSGAALGAGGATAGIGLGAERALGHQGKKWITQGIEHTRTATQIVPSPHKMKPGTTKAQAELSGHFRGQAAQSRYFGRTYLGAAKVARKARYGGLAVAGAGAAGLAGGALKRDKVHKASTPALMSDTELRRRRKLQGKIGRTTSTLGLAGAAIGTAAVAGSKSKGALRAITKVPGLKKATPAGMKEAGLYTGLAAGGIGGVGGFNAASIYSDEARRRKQTVKKDLGMEMGYYGEEGNPLAPEEIEALFEKAWSPVASNFDSEASRHKRAEIGEPVLAGVGVGATGAGAYAGIKGAKLKRKNSTPGQVKAAGFPRVRVAQAARHASAVKHGKAAAVLGAVGAAGLGGAAVAHHGRKNSWQSYGKRDACSAFGIDHE